MGPFTSISLVSGYLSESGLSQGSAMNYDLSRILPGMSTENYHAAWLERFTDLPTEYINDHDIYRHQHLIRF